MTTIDKIVGVKLPKPKEERTPFDDSLVHVLFEDSKGHRYPSDMTEKQWLYVKAKKELEVTLNKTQLKLLEEFLNASEEYNIEISLGE